MQHRELRGQSLKDTEARRSQETRSARLERRSTAGRFGVRRLACRRQACRRFFSYDRCCWLRQFFAATGVRRRRKSGSKLPHSKKKKPRTESGRSFLQLNLTGLIMALSRKELMTLSWHRHVWLCACGVRAVHLQPSSPLRSRSHPPPTYLRRRRRPRAMSPPDMPVARSVNVPGSGVVTIAETVA